MFVECVKMKIGVEYLLLLNVNKSVYEYGLVRLIFFNFIWFLYCRKFCL